MASMWKSRSAGLGVLFLSILVAACGGRSPEPEPTPAPDTRPTVETRDESEDRARDEAARREEEERRRREAERNRVISLLGERVHFDFDRSDIRPDAETVLQRKVSVLREYPGIRLRIEGHADERGSNEYNLALGQRRAEAVRRYLVSYGVGADRFAIISYGEERPLVDASNEDAWAQNRRAEFVITDHGRLGAMD